MEWASVGVAVPRLGELAIRKCGRPTCYLFIWCIGDGSAGSLDGPAVPSAMHSEGWWTPHAGLGAPIAANLMSLPRGA